MIKARDYRWDMVRGMSIIAVILLHTTSASSTAGVVWRQFVNFPVSMFFFLAGYFCHCEGSFSRFAKKKGKRVLVPLALFSVMYAMPGLVQCIADGRLVIVSAASALLSFPGDWGYFPISLFQCFLLYPLLKKSSVKVRLSCSILCYALSFAYFAVAVVCFPNSGMTAGMMPHILCTSWLPMFCLGISLAERKNDFMYLCRRDTVLLGVLTLTLSIAEGLCYYLCVGSRQLAMTQIKPFSMAFSCVLAIFLWQGGRSRDLDAAGQMQNNCAVRGICILGQASFFVYLWHKAVIMLIRRFTMGIHQEIMFFVMPMAVLAASLLAVRLLLSLPDRIRKKLWIIGF